MTTTYRRVTELSPDGLVRAIGERLARDLDDCDTTDDALDRVQPHELAHALAELAADAGTPRRVAIISEAQAEEVRCVRGPGSSPAAARCRSTSAGAGRATPST